MHTTRTLFFTGTLVVCLISLCAAQEAVVPMPQLAEADADRAVDELSNVNIDEKVSELDNLGDKIEEEEVIMEVGQTADVEDKIRSEQKFFKKCWVVYKKCCKVPYSKKFCDYDKCCKEDYKMVKYHCGWEDDKYDDKHDDKGWSNDGGYDGGYGYKPKKPKYCEKKVPYKKCWKCEKCYEKWFFKSYCSPHEKKYIDFKK